ncbi:MAG: DNA-binding protein, partial [Candidatus Bathyarchaeia archaeon]
VKVYGGVRPPSKNHPQTINLEKLRILKLAPKLVYINPKCPKCQKRLKSMGREKGFKCKKCGSRFPNLNKLVIREKREVKRGLYITPPRSQRHLTKPLSRYGMEKHHPTFEGLIKEWHWP